MQAGGREFDPRRVHQLMEISKRKLRELRRLIEVYGDKLYKLQGVVGVGVGLSKHDCTDVAIRLRVNKKAKLREIAAVAGAIDALRDQPIEITKCLD